MKANVAFCDFVIFAAGDDIGQGRLARAIGTHNRVDLAGTDAKVDALQNRLAVYAGV